MNAAIEQAIDIAGSQETLARLAGVTQATISVLKNGRKGRPVIPRFKTAKSLSDAVDGEIPWQRFMEIKQGESNGDSHEQGEARTTGAGDTAPVAARNGGQITPESTERGETHCGDPEVADG